MNKLHLVGTVSKSPAYHCTARGQDVVRLHLRTQTNGVDQIHHCTVWGPLGLSLHERLRVGDTIAVQGQLLYRSYTYCGKTFRLPAVKVLACCMLARTTTPPATTPVPAAASVS